MEDKDISPDVVMEEDKARSLFIAKEERKTWWSST